tara:strand:+ start:30 stop:506 length:477 start_codon:yes stop_codon:yes gene_type:complete
MAITINGSGITSANIADGAIVNADVSDLAASKLTGALPAISGASLTSLTSSQVDSGSTTAKAWVNFNGTGTVAIRASFNISSITDSGVGDYTISFTSAMQDANYIAPNNYSAIVTDNTSTSTMAVVDKLAGSCRVDCENGNASPVQADFALIDIAIFR